MRHHNNTEVVTRISIFVGTQSHYTYGGAGCPIRSYVALAPCNDAIEKQHIYKIKEIST
jgi:hypothetical protein